MAEININYLNAMAPVSGFNIGGNILSLKLMCWGKEGTSPDPHLSLNLTMEQRTMEVNTLQLTEFKGSAADVSVPYSTAYILMSETRAMTYTLSSGSIVVAGWCSFECDELCEKPVYSNKCV